MYLANSNRLLQFLYPSLTWHKERSKKEVFLTFDDGPTPKITNWVLEQLALYNAKATFFLIGKNVEAYPEVKKAIQKEGHSIGNHTHDHLNGWKTRHEEYIKNVEECSTLTSSSLFRPPYGRIGRKQSNTLLAQGYDIIMWDILSGDFDTSLHPQDCIRIVKKYIKPGSIIVFHDSEKAWPRLKEALPEVLRYISSLEYDMRCL